MIPVRRKNGDMESILSFEHLSKSFPGVQALAVKVAARMSRIDDALYEEFLCILRNMELGYYSAGVRAAVRNCLKYKSKVK